MDKKKDANYIESTVRYKLKCQLLLDLSADKLVFQLRSLLLGFCENAYDYSSATVAEEDVRKRIRICCKTVLRSVTSTNQI